MKRETERLWLEPYTLVHAEGLFVVNSDPVVMRHLGGPETMAQTKAGIGRAAQRWATVGFGWWALIKKESGDLIGAACLQHVENDPNKPLEIGWRLCTKAQGKGFATEAGQAAMDYAFGVVKADRVIATTVPENLASQRVMQRLGMTDIGLQLHYGKMCVTYEALASIPTA